MADRRVLVAGIGNLFLGDDGFGVEVVRRLAEKPTRPQLDLVDFGIRGYDLAFALVDGYDAAILVDAVPLGKTPGTVTLLEPEVEGLPEMSPSSHAMNPVAVLAHARQFGVELPRIFVVGCEPEDLGDEETGKVGLSASVDAAVDEAIALVESVAGRLLALEEVT